MKRQKETFTFSAGGIAEGRIRSEAGYRLTEHFATYKGKGSFWKMLLCVDGQVFSLGYGEFWLFRTLKEAEAAAERREREKYFPHLKDARLDAILHGKAQ